MRTECNAFAALHLLQQASVYAHLLAQRASDHDNLPHDGHDTARHSSSHLNPNNT